MSIRHSRRQLLAGAGALSGMSLLGARAARAQALAPASLANAAGNLNLAIQQTILDQGFFEKYGVKPSIINVADGSKIMGGLIGGDLDASMMAGFGQIFPAIEKGAKLKVLAGASLLPSLTMFTSKRDVRSLKDLEGKTIGTGSIGALIHQLCVAILMKNNVDVSKIRFVNIGASGDIFRATLMGTVDAGIGETALIEDLDTYPNLREVPGGNMTTGLPEYTYQGTWTSDRAIQAKRDVLVRCLAAHSELYSFLHNPDSKDAFLKSRAKILPASSPREAIVQWDYIQQYKPYAVDLVLSEERLTYMQKLNIETKAQTSVMPFDKVADMSIARDALALVKKTNGK
jgi:ABC-type nitrate/sulfonate/bicarbonate transport system substrate-binding protein